MALDVYFRDDIRDNLVADVVLVVSTVMETGGDVEVLPKLLAWPRSQALRYGIEWREVQLRAYRALPAWMLAVVMANTRVFAIEPPSPPAPLPAERGGG